MSTLRDVASRAGVSVATASRVASGGGNVRADTRSRVERAMRELLYVPPGRPAATGVIGLLVPELANPIFPALAQAIETRAAPSGLASILCNTQSAAYREIDYVHMLLDRGVEGMIFISCEMTNLSGDHSHYERLIAEGARIVFVNGTLTGVDVPSIGVDERTAGELATRHLIELGTSGSGSSPGPSTTSDPAQERRPRGGAGRRRDRPERTCRVRRVQRRRRPRGARAPAAALGASDRGHLLVGRDGDRRTPGGGAARACASPRTSPSSASTASPPTGPSRG